MAENQKAVFDRNKWTPEQIKEYNANNYYGCNSFSGADMVAVMHITGINGINGTYTLGSLQTLSYSTSMQRSPIRSIGNVNAKDYVMGPRTIAGSLVFAVFDRHFAYEAMKAIRGITEEDYHFLADELPPFDITITFANEYGKMAKLAIYGIRLVNEGQVMSINDIYTENTYQYVATDIDYLSDQTTNTSGQIYEPLKPNPNSTSNPIIIEDIPVVEPEEEEDIAKYQLVYADPIDAYVENGIQTLGKVSLNLFKKVSYGSIILTQTDLDIVKSFDLTEGVQFPIVDNELLPGNYSVYYTSGKSNSKTTFFVINNKKSTDKKPQKPAIVLEEKNSDNTFTIGIQATDTCTKGIQYTDNVNDDTTWKIIEPANPYSIVSKLKECTSYYFRAFNGSEVSEHVKCYTDGKKEHLFSDFEDYVNKNKFYLQDIWSYVQDILNKTYEEWKVTPTFSIVTAMQNIKKSLDLTNLERNRAYNRLMSIATSYEQNHQAYASQSSVIPVPTIVNEVMCQLEFPKNVVKLGVYDVKRGYRTDIQKNSFQDWNQHCYRYVLTTSQAGVFEVTAFGANGDKSPALVLHMPEQQVANELMESMRDHTLMINNQLNAFTAKGFTSPEVLETATAAQKSMLAFEMNNSSKVQKQGIGDPIVTTANENGVSIYCDVPFKTTARAIEEQYYLCVLPSEKVGYSNFKEKVLITNNDFNFTLYKSKFALRDGVRYCIWIEDESGKIISRTTAFDFNLETSQIALFKSCEIVADTRSTFSLMQNRIKADDFKTDPLLSESKLYDNIIVDNIVDIAPSDVKQLEYIHDAIQAKHKRNNVSITRANIPGLVINPSLKYISGDFKTQGYTKAYLKQYNEHGEFTTQVYNINKDFVELVGIDSIHLKCASIYFSNDTNAKVSEIITIGYPRKEYISNMKVEVKW